MHPMTRATALCIFSTACADAAGPASVASVEVTPPASEVWAGDTVTLSATARAAGGAVLTGRSITWTSSRPSIAAVDPAGRVVAIASGDAVITAIVEGVSGQATLAVTVASLLIEGDVGSGPEIFMVSEGKAPERVLPEGTVAMDPVASPDGSRIAFVVANYDDWTGDIWVVNRDGTGAVKLIGDGWLDDAPAWSPDGTRIAFRSYRSELQGEIWMMNVDGSGRVNLTPQVGGGAIDHHRPAWSPDGTRIAFASTAGGDWGIWTVKVDGSDRRLLTETAELDTEPSWSPDGQWIAFRRSNPAQGADIMIIPAAGGTATRIALAGEQRQPAWSPDGRRIAFVGSTTLGDPPEVFTMRPDGSDVRRHTSVSGWGPGHNPSWVR